MSATKTTVSFIAGPWDGDTREFEDPPLIVKVGGETQGFAYSLISLDQYHWMRCLSHTIRTGPRPPSPSKPPPKPFNPWKCFVLVTLTAFGILFILAVAGRIEIDAEQKAGLGKDKALLKSAQEIREKTPVVPVPTPAPTPVLTEEQASQRLLKSIENYLDHPAEPLSVSEYKNAHQFLEDEIVLKNPVAEQLLKRLEKTQSPLTPTSQPVAAPRAQPANPQTAVMMPYGEQVVMHFRGTLPNQEALPRLENDIGDAYQIGKDVFVWVTPNGGPGQWIDPVIP